MDRTMGFSIETTQVLVSKQLGAFEYFRNEILGSGSGSFFNFINLPENPNIDKFSAFKFKLDDNDIFGILSLNSPKVTHISTIHFTSLGDIISRLGGFYSAIVTATLVLSSPFLYLSFMRTLTQQIHSISRCKDRSTQEIEDKIKERIEYRSLFVLYDRVELLEKA